MRTHRLLIAVTLGAVLSLLADLRAEERRWFKLSEGETYVADFTLGPGETRDIEIVSESPLWVGFYSDASFEQAATFAKQHQNPIRLSWKVNPKNSVASTMGASTVFQSKDGKVSITAKNSADIPFRIVNFTKPKR